jgi:hypothetical protein
MPEEKEDKGFKVIDRRGVEAAPEPPLPSPKPPPREEPPSEAAGGIIPGDAGVSPPKRPLQDSPLAGAKEGAPRFLDLVQSLQMGAMIGLGMIQGPDGKRPPVDLPKEEEEVLREGLYHLRMGYMAMINAPLAGREKGGDQR